MDDPLPPATPPPVTTVAQRRAAGIACRKIIPRRGHGMWSPAPDRPDPVQALLSANVGRLSELLPIKWSRMAASPFGFFRGACALMALDLKGHPVTGLSVQICGDAHVRNLGAYAAPDGHLVFDLNDFDETLGDAPWEWDVKRLATSLILANRDAGGGDEDGLEAVRAFARCYRQALRRFAAMHVVDLMIYEVRRYPKHSGVQQVLRKAERATPGKNLTKLTVPGPSGQPRFHDQPPLLSHVEEAEAGRVLASLGAYRETLGLDRRQTLDAYQPVDVTFKVVGTGSIGTRDYVVLLLGNGPDDALFLQVKEELPSAWRPALTGTLPSAHQGRRVAEGQHRCQSETDPFIGWTRIEGRDYLVRQLADHKASLDLVGMADGVLCEYARVCGEILAKAHARSGDAAALAGYVGGSDRLEHALADFALVYAAQTVQDHVALVAAIQRGELQAAAGL
jgi:uncharacterized protein (DUF2252 family)